MTATLDDVTSRENWTQLTAAERAAEELVRRACEQGISLTGPDGLLMQLTKTLLETALNQELREIIRCLKQYLARTAYRAICASLASAT
jgi:putative transposase